MTSSRYQYYLLSLPLSKQKKYITDFSHIRGVFPGKIEMKSYVGRESLKWISHNVPQCCLLRLSDRVNRDLNYQQSPLALTALVLLDPVMYVVFLPLRAACCHPQRRAAEPQRAELWPQREAALPFMSCRAPSITAMATPLIYDVTWGCCVGFDSGDTSKWVGEPACWWTDVLRMFCNFYCRPHWYSERERARISISVIYLVLGKLKHYHLVNSII